MARLPVALRVEEEGEHALPTPPRSSRRSRWHQRASRNQHSSRNQQATREVRFGARRSAAVFLVAMSILILGGREAARPARHLLSERFRQRGDTYLNSLSCDEAVREYRRALRLNPENSSAQRHLSYALAAPTDIKAARPFFAATGNTTVLQKLDKAEREYPTAKSALTAGLELLAGGDTVYARYPIEQAVRLDENYPEAWHYLSRVYGELAGEQAGFRTQAEEAVKKRDSLTVKYILEQESVGGQ
jgi:Tfp pilus assembly protein PilF